MALNSEGVVIDCKVTVPMSATEYVNTPALFVWLQQCVNHTTTYTLGITYNCS